MSEVLARDEPRPDLRPEQRLTRFLDQQIATAIRAAARPSNSVTQGEAKFADELLERLAVTQLTEIEHAVSLPWWARACAARRRVILLLPEWLGTGRGPSP